MRTGSVGACLVLALVFSCELSIGEDIRLQGSTSAADALRLALSEGFNARYADVELEWKSAGSGAAFVALFAGEADVAVASRRVRAEEVELASRLGLELRESLLALDGLAVVVHPSNDVPSLSMEQLESLYTGRIVRWLGFGGIDEAVRPLSFSPSSGAESEFREVVLSDPTLPFAASTDYLSSSEEILERVASDVGAVGFVSMSYDRSSVRTIPIVNASGEAQLPSLRTIGSGDYPLSSVVRLYTVSDPSDELEHFLRFLYLHDGPALIVERGLVPVQSFAVATRWSLHERARPAVSVVRIGFGFRGSRLDSDARADLAEVATRLETSDDGVWIRGHEEPTEARDDLAGDRARAVAEFLEQRSIGRARMTVDSRGTSEPIAANSGLDGRRLNRRVDVWILPR